MRMIYQVCSHINWFVTSPLLVGRDGDRVVSSQECQHVSPCLLPRFGKGTTSSVRLVGVVACHWRKVTYCHWFGEEGSYQSKDDEVAVMAHDHRALLPSHFILSVVLLVICPDREVNRTHQDSVKSGLKPSLTDPRLALILSIPA